MNYLLSNSKSSKIHTRSEIFSLKTEKQTNSTFMSKLMSINGSYVLDFSLQRRHWTATQKIHTLSLSSFNTHFRQSNFTEALLQYLIFQFSVRNLPWLLRYPPKIWFTTVVSLLNLSNLREFKGPCNQMKLVISGVKKTQFSFILKKMIHVSTKTIVVHLLCMTI